MSGFAGLIQDKRGKDKHQIALYRLQAVSQYLYYTMADADSDRPSPLPKWATEHLRKAQAEIDAAIKVGQRTRRECLSGQVVVTEHWKDETANEIRGGTPPKPHGTVIQGKGRKDEGQ